MSMLRPAFARAKTFLWFSVAVAGLTVRTDMFGVTSIARALNLDGRYYQRLVKHFHSSAVFLDDLSALWAATVVKIFPSLTRVNGLPMFVGDGIKTSKRGKKMPGVKSLHQQSQNKAEHIMGHSFQAVSILVHAAQSVIAVPLTMRIHEGVITSNRSKRTLFDKMLTLLEIVYKQPCYFVGDAYYANAKMVDGLLARGSHLVSRMKVNSVAFEACQHQGPRKLGRPKMYGKKVKLKEKPKPCSVFKALSPIYGEKDVMIEYFVRDLLWRPAGRLVRFVNVMHPTRGNSLVLMCTDLNLDPLEIIKTYGWRFKIECSFKQAVHQIGIFSYHFWMQKMKAIRYGSCNQYLHRASQEYRAKVFEKLHAYHVFVQACVVTQGLAQYLAVTAPQLVWQTCGTWLRTIRPGIAPSEFVVANALRSSLPEFLWFGAKEHELKKFILQHQDFERPGMYELAA